MASPLATEHCRAPMAVAAATAMESCQKPGGRSSGRPNKPEPRANDERPHSRRAERHDCLIDAGDPAGHSEVRGIRELQRPRAQSGDCRTVAMSWALAFASSSTTNARVTADCCIGSSARSEATSTRALPAWSDRLPVV